MPVRIISMVNTTMNYDSTFKTNSIYTHVRKYYLMFTPPSCTEVHMGTVSTAAI